VFGSDSWIGVCDVFVGVKPTESLARTETCPGPHSRISEIFPPQLNPPSAKPPYPTSPSHPSSRQPREPDGRGNMPPAAHATSPQLADARRSSMNASSTSLASLSEEWGPLDHVVRELTVSLPCGAAANAWGPRSDAPARASSGPTQQPRVQLRRVVAAAVQLHRRRHRR
jgi:hypothetical protein